MQFRASRVTLLSGLRLDVAEDHSALADQINRQQQQVVDHRQTLEVRDEGLAAARKAHRRLMAEANRADAERRDS